MRIIHEALTFDDVLLVPAYSDVLPREVRLQHAAHPPIRLNIPMLSAAMDTVTEARLAITMAQEGGIGIIHKNMTIERAGARSARGSRSSRAASSTTRSPCRPTRRSARCSSSRARSNISGVPVVDGEQAGRHRHAPRPALRDASSTRRCRRVMTPQGAPGHGARGRSQGRSARAAAQAPHREGAGGRRRVRAARADHRQGHPEGARQSRTRARTSAGALRVGAAVGTGGDTEERVAALRRGGRRRPGGRHRARPLAAA